MFVSIVQNETASSIEKKMNVQQFSLSTVTSTKKKW